MSTDSAISIAWDVLKCLVAPLKRGFSYVMSSKSYADNLRKEVGNLEYEAERIRHAAEGAENNLRSIHGWVPEFLASAEKALIEARDLLGKFEKASKTCCHGTLPDPNCRYQFSRKAKHETDDIKNLILKNSNREISFSGPAPGNVAALIPAGREGKDVVQSTTTAASASSVDFESRDLMIRNIMDALVDNRYSVVGVHGMGGVGKSTLLVDAEKRIREKKLFDWVAKADVSQNPDIKRIQGEIAHELGLDFKKEEFVSVRAKLLCERLEAEGKTKKVLIILDNLWEQLDLKSVGIPCGHNNKVMGCKLLLTSRDQRVLRREMHCDNAFVLYGLENEEAKRLFETEVGGKVQVELEPLVEEALSICAGLPFLILAIAKLFIDTSYSECKDALKQIWNEETGEVINKTLRVSYDRIKREEAKSLLRLCVACGVSKPSLEYLVRYGMGLRLFREASSMEEARERLGSLIHTLKASSLLLEDEDGNGFKIHDLVCGFVISIASRDHPLLILKDNNKLLTELSKDKLKSCEAICFPYVKLEKLPEELDCPELQIFMLFTKNNFLEVSDSYFNSMRNLIVLNLNGIRLNRSPSPFQFLENLYTLCLDRSSLEDVAVLGKLKGLQILSLMNSEIQRLSKEIGQLVELRLLDLNHCSNLQGIVEVDESGKFEMRNMHVLKLHSLPHIKNFFIAKSAPLSSTSNNLVGTQIAFFNGQQCLGLLTFAIVLIGHMAMDIS
ncbi:probable disease resistance protein At4g27220 [Eucalyptus grandis]|uniref:probable disease resistance protein At4g27220 n=1 Tax=Eucalyptus grandis TaxID=71139 RepID=UPI00192E7B40|nr:probable disease resistance protein At4g27220 [Eucalyptus grandis]